MILSEPRCVEPLLRRTETVFRPRTFRPRSAPKLKLFESDSYQGLGSRELRRENLSQTASINSEMPASFWYLVKLHPSPEEARFHGSGNLTDSDEPGCFPRSCLVTVSRPTSGRSGVWDLAEASWGMLDALGYICTK